MEVVKSAPKKDERKSQKMNTTDKQRKNFIFLSIRNFVSNKWNTRSTRQIDPRNDIKTYLGVVKK